MLRAALRSAGTLRQAVVLLCRGPAHSRGSRSRQPRARAGAGVAGCRRQDAIGRIESCKPWVEHMYGYTVSGEMTEDERERLILEHLPQVRLIARRIQARLPDSISIDRRNEEHTSELQSL